MRNCLLVFSLLFVMLTPHAVASGAQADWLAKVEKEMPMLGHRNWILVVDSAYPLQTSPGIETIETNANQVDVVRSVIGAIHRSIHVRPLIYMDAELPFVSDADAPGASAYRTQIHALLSGSKIESLPHEKLLGDVDEAGKTFHILVLKTTMTIPYTSVFIRLDCKYWSAEAQDHLLAKMKSASAH